MSGGILRYRISRAQPHRHNAALTVPDFFDKVDIEAHPFSPGVQRMGAQVHAAVQPATLVRAPASTSLYARLPVTNTASSLISLLPSSVLPTLTVPNMNIASGSTYVIRGVWLQSETALATAVIRYTADGQTVPTSTLGLQVNDLNAQVPTQIYCDPADIQLIGSIAGPTFVQCYLVIQAISSGQP